MQVLAAVQAIIACAFLLVGAVALFGVGITGVLFLVPGAVFGASAGVALDGSRAGVALAAVLDGLLAFFAARRLQALLELAPPNADAAQQALGLVRVRSLDVVVPSLALALVAVALVAVLLDWRSLRRAPWF